MDSLISSLEALFPRDVWITLTILSILFFVGSLIAIPFIIVKLPADYFDERRPRTWMQDSHPILRLTFHIAKNLLGAIFFLAGLTMLVLPGQGILTMLIGISMMDFPGKRRFERKLVGQPVVLETVNKLRKRFGQPPLVVTDEP